MADKIIASPGGDGKRVGYRYMPEDYEPVEGEAVLPVPPDPDLLVWDHALGGPRAKTDEERADEARQEALERLASEATTALGIPSGPFINPDDVLGLVASVLKRMVDEAPVTLDPREQAALDLLHGEYGNAVAKKAEVAQADPKDLDDIRWRE